MKNCLTPKNPKTCDPILVTLLKIRPHYSHSRRENATRSSGKSPIASYKEVPPPPGWDNWDTPIWKGRECKSALRWGYGYRKIPKTSPGACIFQRPFLRGLYTEGYLRFKINWASLIVGSKCTVLALFYFVLRAIFQVQAPAGLYLEGRFNGGFFALHGGAYFRIKLTAKTVDEDPASCKRWIYGISGTLPYKVTYFQRSPVKRHCRVQYKGSLLSSSPLDPLEGLILRLAQRSRVTYCM